MILIQNGLLKLNAAMMLIKKAATLIPVDLQIKKELGCIVTTARQSHQDGLVIEQAGLE